MEVSYLALGSCNNADAEKAHQFIKARSGFAVSRQPIQTFRHYQLLLSRAHIDKKPLISWSKTCSAGNRPVDIDVYDNPASLTHQQPATYYLLDRDQQSLAELLRARPALARYRLAPMHTIQAKSRDVSISSPT